MCDHLRHVSYYASSMLRGGLVALALASGLSAAGLGELGEF